MRRQKIPLHLKSRSNRGALTLFKAVALIVGALLCAPVAFGVWLLLTPDYDGGRQAVGSMIVGAAALVVLVLLAVYFVARRQSSS